MDKPEWFEEADANESVPESSNRNDRGHASRFAKRFAVVGAAALLAGGGAAYASTLTSHASVTTNSVSANLDAATSTPTPSGTPTATPDAATPTTTANTQPTIAGVAGGDDEEQGDNNQGDDGDVNVNDDNNQGDDVQVSVDAQIGVDNGQSGR